VIGEPAAEFQVTAALWFLLGGTPASITNLVCGVLAFWHSDSMAQLEKAIFWSLTDGRTVRPFGIEGWRTNAATACGADQCGHTRARNWVRPHLSGVCAYAVLTTGVTQTALHALLWREGDLGGREWNRG